MNYSATVVAPNNGDGIDRADALVSPPDELLVIAGIQFTNVAEPPRLVLDGVSDETDAVNWYLDRGLQFPELRSNQRLAVRLHALRGGSGVGIVVGDFLGSAPRRLPASEVVPCLAPLASNLRVADE